jgi:hypothetical protein
MPKCGQIICSLQTVTYWLRPRCPSRHNAALLFSGSLGTREDPRLLGRKFEVCFSWKRSLGKGAALPAARTHPLPARVGTRPADSMRGEIRASWYPQGEKTPVELEQRTVPRIADDEPARVAPEAKEIAHGRRYVGHHT